MYRVWSRITVAALVASAAACRPPASRIEATTERVTGCFRRIYADGPPADRSGSTLYTLTTEAGSTMLLEVSPAQLTSAGGVSRLDGARVIVVLAPMRDSSTGRPRTARVHEIRLEPGTSGSPC
jgi:hypothetical protein